MPIVLKQVRWRSVTFAVLTLTRHDPHRPIRRIRLLFGYLLFRFLHSDWNVLRFLGFVHGSMF